MDRSDVPLNIMPYCKHWKIDVAFRVFVKRHFFFQNALYKRFLMCKHYFDHDLGQYHTVFIHQYMYTHSVLVIIMHFVWSCSYLSGTASFKNLVKLKCQHNNSQLNSATRVAYDIPQTTTIACIVNMFQMVTTTTPIKIRCNRNTRTHK